MFALHVRPPGFRGGLHLEQGDHYLLPSALFAAQTGDLSCLWPSDAPHEEYAGCVRKYPSESTHLNAADQRLQGLSSGTGSGGSFNPRRNTRQCRLWYISSCRVLIPPGSPLLSAADQRLQADRKRRNF
jgi:hypothetical protein